MGRTTIDDKRLTAVFLSLLRSSLWDRSLAEREVSLFSDLSSADWNAIWEMARRQSVSALVGGAIENLPGTIAVPPELEYAVFAHIDRLSALHRRQQAAVEELTALFCSGGLTPVYMKGLEVARLYPVPELRELGDIDVYFPEDTYRQALERVRSHTEGDFVRAPDGSLHFQFHGFDVDMHRSFFDLPLRTPIPDVFSPEAQLLMLNIHILKHACSAGVGLRQFCDLARAYSVLPYSESVYREMCSEAGISRWTLLLSSFLKKNLGASNLPFADASFPDPSPLERIVRRGGNFGHHSTSRKAALAGRPLFRKADTFLRLLSSLPFSLRYAPRTTFHWLSSLVPGQFTCK